MATGRKTTLRIHLFVLLLYAGLALLLTWPLALRLTTHMPGDGIDDPALAWNLWWIKFRLLDQLNPDIFHVDWMFYPIQINLGFYTLTPLNGLLSIPLQTGLSLILASNLLLLSSFWVGGYGTFLLAVYGLRRHLRLSHSLTHRSALYQAAFLAGVIVAFASSKLFYASLGQYNIASSQWVPLTILFVLRCGEEGKIRARTPLLAGLFLTMQAWAELTYASFLLIFITVYFLWQIFSPGEKPGFLRGLLANFGRLLPRFLTLGGIFGLGIAPFLWAMLPDMRSEGDFFARGGGFTDIFSADLLGYLLPTRLHPLLGSWVATLPFPNDKAQQIFLGYSALLLAGSGAYALLRRRPRRWFWPATSFLFWWLTLGPQIRWAGHPLPIPGPFTLVSRLPFFSGNRYPSRYGVMLLVCVAMLAAVGAYSLLWRLHLRWPSRYRTTGQSAVAGFLIILFLGEHLSIPLPLNDFQTPAIYQELAQIPGDFAVLELPTGWRNGARVLGRSDLVIMMQQWYQTTHQKRRLGGNTSRNPAYKFQYFTEAPLLGDLIGLMNSDQPHLAPYIEQHLDDLIQRYRKSAPGILTSLDVRYVTLHLQRAPAALIRFVEEALPLQLVQEWQGADWAGEPGAIRLYRVTTPPVTGPWTLDLTQPEARLALGAGWSALPDPGTGARYATRQQPDLLINLPNQAGVIQLDLVGPARLMGAQVNGQRVQIGKESESEGQRTVLIEIPDWVASQPVDRLALKFDATYDWQRVIRAGQPVSATGSYDSSPLALLAVSAGEEVGDFAQIFVNGREYALGERGYNLVAVGLGGEIMGRRVFDTHGDAQASTLMATWLAQWPTGTQILGAVNDEASYRLGDDGVKALRVLGVSGDLRNRFRWSHAWITTVGQPGKLAQEALQILQPARVYRTFPLEAEKLSGGVRSLQWRLAETESTQTP